MTIASGFAGYNLGLFVLLSIITRGMRFFAEAFLLKRYGPRARAIIEKRLGFWVTISVLVLVAGFIAVTIWSDLEPSISPCADRKLGGTKGREIGRQRAIRLTELIKQIHCADFDQGTAGRLRGALACSGPAPRS